MRRTIVALLSAVCLFGAVRPAAAENTVPTVTIMLSSTGELESDIEAIMKMGGKEAEEQWPIIQAILPAFNALGIYLFVMCCLTVLELARVEW